MSTLRLADIAAPDRILEAVVDGTMWRLPVRGSLTITQMARLLQLEQTVNAARADGDALIAVCADVQTEIMRILRERTPDAPNIEFSLEEAMSVLGWLAGDTSATAAVVDAITPDEPAAAAAAEEGTAPGPLAERSTSSSPGLSSSSADGTDGAPSGGPSAPGEPSEPIFATSSGS